MKTLMDELHRYHALGRVVTMTNYGAGWECRITGEADGIKASAEGQGSLPSEAFAQATARWKRLTSLGVPELAGPQIEHRNEPVYPPSSYDGSSSPSLTD